jgi:transaldolase
MKATGALHDQGQSLWLDNITRDLLETGTLGRYIDELSVTGLTSNPTIFDHAIKNSSAYDAAIRKKVKEGKSGEDLFFELALEDLTRAADLFRPIWDSTRGVDGWVSLEVSPLLAHDTASTLAAAKPCTPARDDRTSSSRSPAPRRAAGHRGGDLRRHTDQRDASLLVRAVPGGGRRFHARHRAPHRRLQPEIGSVASVFISRWDAAVKDRVPEALRNSWASRSRSGPTRRTARCSALRAGSASSTPAPARNACCGPARAPRTPARLTSCMSGHSRRRSR